MVDAFVSFVRTIAVYLIFYAFIEMLLPTSNLKKYVNLCLGLLMIVIILEPIFTLLNGESFQFKAIDSQLSKQIDDNSQYEKLQNELIIRNYKLQISEQIRIMLLEKLNINVQGTEIEVEEDGFGKINDITIFVGGDAQSEINIIKNTISNFYNMSIDNIHVIVR